MERKQKIKLLRKEGAFNQTSYIREYNKEMYDRITLFVKKGEKNKISKFIKKNKESSMNAYVTKLIMADIEKRG